MTLFRSTRYPVLAGNLVDYQKIVRATAPANLAAYWPLADLSGTVADNAEGTAARDGTYSGVTLANDNGPDGKPAPLFDGVNDNCNIYSASLAGVFNGAEGTIAIWGKIPLATWSDSTRRALCSLGASATDELSIEKTTSANTLQWYYEAGGTLKAVTLATAAPTGWFHTALTWSAAADEVKAYYDGAQTGSTQTGLGTWAGALATTRCALGALFSSGSRWFSGHLAGAAIWNTPLTAAQISTLATL